MSDPVAVRDGAGRWVEEALRILGWSVKAAAPGLLRVDPPSRPGTRDARVDALVPGRLVALDATWLARVPGAVLAAPGTPLARHLWQAVAHRSRFAVLAGPMGRGAPLRRHLLVRTVVLIACFALPEGVRRRVVDVLVDPEEERAWPIGSGLLLPGGGMMDVLRPIRATRAMGWLSPYEVGRLAGVARRVAQEAARREAQRCRLELQDAYVAERARLSRYFERRQVEEVATLWALYRRAASRLVYARAAAVPEVARSLARDAEALCGRVKGRSDALGRRLAELQREREVAMAELAERFTVRTRVVPAGLAVVWLGAQHALSVAGRRTPVDAEASPDHGCRGIPSGARARS